MKSVQLRSAILSFFVFAVALGCTASIFAQRGAPLRDEDENYNSPTPILLSESTSTRALALPAGDDTRGVSVPIKIRSRAFDPGSKVVLYLTNLALLDGEGANAFRVYADDGRGHSYRFPVIDLQRADGAKNVWAITTILTDEIGYFEPPAADGDVLIYITWRGLSSNQVRLGVGRIGGDIKEPASARPTPIGTTAAAFAPELVMPTRQGDRLRFLEQATFGPKRDFANEFNRTRLRNWILNQFNMQYPSVTNPYPNQPLKPINALADCDGDQTATPDVPVTCQRDTYTMYPLQTWNSVEMLYGTPQLRHKVSWALSQIWVTSGQGIQQSRHMVEYHKILSNNAFGNYRNLMRQMTLSPTMGFYLSMAGSTRLNPNENYAREINQLFTIGLFMLNQDGTVQCAEHNPCQPGDTPVPTYDQNVVNNFTKVFTGWNLCSIAASCPNNVLGSPNYIDPMLLNGGVSNPISATNPNRHDLGAKTLLSYPGSTTTNIDPCPVLPAAGACNATPNATALANISTYAYASLDKAIDNLFYHPNLGPYVSRILIQQMVTSDPTPAYVGRVAAAFNNNGSGVRGDMKAVIMAILLDPEARGDLKTDPNYGKLREPVTYAANILRAFNVRNAAGTGPSDGVLTTRGEYNGMGQVPFRSPTVFNYYPPSFVVPGTSLNGPEFALLTTGTTIQRANFINRFAFTAPAIPVSTGPDVPMGTSLDFSDLQALQAADTTGGAMVDELNKRLLHYSMSATMRTSIITSLTPISNTDTLAKVRQAVYLVLTSSQYQVQR